MSQGIADDSKELEWSDCVSPVPAIGTPVRTACGGTVLYNATIPCVFYRGQAFFFCLPICKAGLETDPHHSCLALGAGR